jgi:hypothetical protein
MGIQGTGLLRHNTLFLDRTGFLITFIYQILTVCNIRFNTLRTGYIPNNIYKLSSYLTGNTLTLHYTFQAVNASLQEKMCLFGE